LKIILRLTHPNLIHSRKRNKKRGGKKRRPGGSRSERGSPGKCLRQRGQRNQGELNIGVAGNNGQAQTRGK